MTGFGNLIMESFVEIIQEIAKNLGLKKNEVALRAWPEMPPRSAMNRWQYMRNQSPKTGQPQGVLISDAYELAKAVGQEMPYVTLQAYVRAAEKVKARAAEAPQEERASDEAPGRSAGAKKATTLAHEI